MPTVNQLLNALAVSDQQKDRLRSQIASAKEKAQEATESIMHSAASIGSGVIGGFVDGSVDPKTNVAGFTLTETYGAVIGMISLTGVAGRFSSLARASTEGALAYALGRRSFKRATEMRKAREAGAPAGAPAVSGTHQAAQIGQGGVVDLGDVKEELARARAAEA